MGGGGISVMECLGRTDPSFGGEGAWPGMMGSGTGVATAAGGEAAEALGVVAVAVGAADAVTTSAVVAFVEGGDAPVGMGGG